MSDPPVLFRDGAKYEQKQKLPGVVDTHWGEDHPGDENESTVKQEKIGVVFAHLSRLCVKSGRLHCESIRRYGRNGLRQRTSNPVTSESEEKILTSLRVNEGSLR